jgi:trigger factor
MNIEKKNIDDLNAVLSLTLQKDDYEKRVEDVLKDYRKKARIDGFRPGKVPFGLINKMYRRPVLLEEVNKLVSESITKYLVDEKLNILGEPIPHEGDTKKIDWDNDEEFEFKFDLGLVPEFDLNITSKDKIPYYLIKTDNALVDKYIESYCQRFGEFISVDEITEKDVLKCELKQNIDGQPGETPGIYLEEASLSVEMIKDKQIKNQVLEARKGDTLKLDLKAAYPDETEIAGMLKIEKEKVADIQGTFNVLIKDISRFQKAEINQELFNKVFGEGIVKEEKDFREKIKEEAKKGLRQDSEYRFVLDVKELLLKKFKSDLPREFLKRWLLLINEGKFTRQQIDEEFEKFEEDLKWQLIKDKILTDNNLKISDEDLMTGAKRIAQLQFSQYGMNNVPEEQLADFAKRMLEREEDRKNIITRVSEDKVIEFVRGAVKLDEKEVSSEKFNKLFEK